MNAADRILELSVDGGRPTDALLRCVTSAFVRQSLNAPALAEVAFADPPADDVRAFGFGAKLVLSLRLGARLFEGEVTAVEYEADGAGGRVFRVRAYDALHRLRKRQRTRAMTDLSLSDLLGEMASDIGVDWQANDAGGRRSLMIQHDQSDLEFLVDFAADRGRYLHLTEGSLRAFSLAGDGDEALPLRLGQELVSGRASASAESLRRSTATRAWDPTHIEALEAATTVASQDAEELRDVGLSAFAGLGERILTNRLSADAAEAEALAQADLDRATASQVILDVIAEGDPRLRPGRLVVIEGLGPEIDGRVCVTQATHLFEEARGYVVELAAAPPPRPARHRASITTLGRVTDSDDPDGHSRVRARLPAYGDVETGWMAVVIAGAGASKGIAILPEPEDDVLVLFPDGDPARGLVLGGLYGERRSPGPRNGSETRSFTLRTPGGQSFTLDSVTSLARLETSAGDVFELTPTGARLHVTQDLLIEAPGRRLTIRADAIEFERG